MPVYKSALACKDKLAAGQKSEEKCEEVCRDCQVEEGKKKITGFVFSKSMSVCFCHTGTVDDKKVTVGSKACFFGK